MLSQTPKERTLRMRTYLLLLFLAAALFTSSSCRKQTSNPQTANSNNPAVQEAPVGGKAMTGDKYFFHGRIAGTLAIEMTLTRDGDRFPGTDFCPHVGKRIKPAGTVDE